MKVSTNLRNVLWIGVVTVVLAVALPATAFGQDHGRGRGRGRGLDLDKKCAKFVNCHDARDGRRDGRGPRRDVGIFRNGVLFPRGRANQRRRDFDDDDLFRSRRLSRRNREFDDDERRERRFHRHDREDRDFDRDDLFRARRHQHQ